MPAGRSSRLCLNYELGSSPLGLTQSLLLTECVTLLSWIWHLISLFCLLFLGIDNSEQYIKNNLENNNIIIYYFSAYGRLKHVTSFPLLRIKWYSAYSDCIKWSKIIIENVWFHFGCQVFKILYIMAPSTGQWNKEFSGSKMQSGFTLHKLTSLVWVRKRIRWLFI